MYYLFLLKIYVCDKNHLTDAFICLGTTYAVDYKYIIFILKIACL